MMSTFLCIKEGGRGEAPCEFEPVMFLTLDKTIGVLDLNGLRVKNRGLLKQGIS
jgi:hypothetical protein